jgi:tetratricopeptide (TPR) repeat protein
VKKPLAAVAAFLFLAVAGRHTFAQEDAKPYQDAVKANPNVAAAHYNLAAYYVKNQLYDQAIPELQKSCQLDPADKQSRALLENCEGIVAYTKGNNSEAVDHFQAALKANPGDADAKHFMDVCQAKVYMDQKRYSEAATVLTEIYDSNSKDIYALQNLGFIYFQQKDYKNARDYWTKAVRLQPDTRIYKYLGFSFYNLGDFNNAISNYKLSIKGELAKDPKEQDRNSLDETYYDMGIAYNDNADFDKAADAFESAYKANPGDANAEVGRAQAIDAAVNAHMEKASGYLLSNQYSQAIAEWEKVLKVQPQNKQAQDFITDAKSKLDSEVNTLYAAGKTAYQKGDKISALNDWNQALEMDPDNEKIQKAVKTMRVGDQSRIKSLLAEGDNYYQAGDYADALTSYLNASKVNPHNPQVRARLKRIHSKQTNQTDDLLAKADRYYSKGDLKDAQKFLLDAKQSDPSNDRVNNQLFKVQKSITVKVKDLDADGVSLFEGGNKEKAQARFQEALKLKPDDETANDYVKKITGQQAHEKVDAEQVKALYYDGVNLYINGKIHEAIAKWDECLKLDPGNINAQNNRQKAMIKLKSIEQLSKS